MKRSLFITFIILFLLTLAGCDGKPSVGFSVPTTTETQNTNQANQESENTTNNAGNSDTKELSAQKPSDSETIVKEDEDSKFTEKLNKFKTLQELQEKKNFMLAAAQDDLEHYIWGEECAYSDIWQQMCFKYGLDGHLIMLALQSDLDTYLTWGNSDYALVWAIGDLSYEAFTTGKMKEEMTEQDYNKLITNLNAVKKRLGILYAKREYILPQN